MRGGKKGGCRNKVKKKEMSEKEQKRQKKDSGGEKGRKKRAWRKGKGLKNRQKERPEMDSGPEMVVSMCFGEFLC